MSGLWVFICGASGAGKDSVIRWASQQLAGRHDIVFSRRMVTRPPHPDSDHDPVTCQHFFQLIGSGDVAWRWSAHGFHYGIRSDYASDVASGRIVVVNGSREHTNQLADAEQVRVVEIVAAPEQIAERLLQRGREASEEVNQRLARNSLVTSLRADYTIANTGELAQAGQQLADYLAAIGAPSYSR